MGDRGGISQRGCKWHLRQQSEGVCATCLRKSLEKLAADQGEYQQSLDTYTGALSSNSVAEVSIERDCSAQSFQTTYPSVSYRFRSDKYPKGGSTSHNRSISDFRKPKGAACSKDKLSWGLAVHRIASLRSAFASLWKSDKEPQVKREQNIGVRDKPFCKPYGQNESEEVRKEKLYELQYAANCETRRVIRDSDRNATRSCKTMPWIASSFFLSKFTHRSSNLDDNQTQWRRSKSSREASRDVQVPIYHLPGISDGDPAYDAPSLLQPVPLASSKSSPWRFFSRSGSRHSPHGGFKAELPITTLKGSTAFDSTQGPAMVTDRRSSPVPPCFSPILGPTGSVSSPSMVKPSPPSHISLGS